MADVTKLRSLQDQLSRSLLALWTASAAEAVFIQENIANLQRQINRLLFIVNQGDGFVDTHKMPPPPAPKL